jgi:SRSO17 transposase
MRPSPDDRPLWTNRIVSGGRAFSVEVGGWVEKFESGFARIAGRFGRVEPRQRAWAFLLDLLSDLDTRSCGQLAEQAGDRLPHRMQRLSGGAV